MTRLYSVPVREYSNDRDEHLGHFVTQEATEYW